jgi:hypothetical protein
MYFHPQYQGHFIPNHEVPEQDFRQFQFPGGFPGWGGYPGDGGGYPGGGDGQTDRRLDRLERQVQRLDRRVDRLNRRLRRVERQLGWQDNEQW